MAILVGKEEIPTLLICGLLTAVAAVLTVCFSALFGAAIAFRARSTFTYGLILALLFVPFAVGGSVWAYCVARFANSIGLQARLLESGTLSRAFALLLFGLCRSIPLGALFCATSLQRHSVDLLGYFRVNQLRYRLFLVNSLGRISESTLMLLGLFGGALMATDASLPPFLYRANPGTAPETLNIMLERMFRELFTSAGPESLTRVAAFGAAVSFFFIFSAAVGSFLGCRIVFLGRSVIRTFRPLPTQWDATLSAVGQIALVLPLLPGLLCVVGGLFFTGNRQQPYILGIDHLLEYQHIVLLGTLVGVFVTVLSVAVAIRLRYSTRDWLATVERSRLASLLLFLPAFIPTLTIIAFLARFTEGEIVGPVGYICLFINHVALRYSVIQFVCFTLVATIPEYHVAWQRTVNLRYTFSLLNDGFRRHIVLIVSLVALGTVQVVTDGSVSRWFSHFVKAPEEALYAAIFGRLASAAEATLIVRSVLVIAIVICCILGVGYVRDVRSRQRYG